MDMLSAWKIHIYCILCIVHCVLYTFKATVSQTSRMNVAKEAGFLIGLEDYINYGFNRKHCDVDMWHGTIVMLSHAWLLAGKVKKGGAYCCGRAWSRKLANTLRQFIEWINLKLNGFNWSSNSTHNRAQPRILSYTESKVNHVRI